ncbi:hypothetical protein [Streptomyces sp. NPDC058874]|uniref:hypothetical protein n=1 Tax=unclassified Streptomyces TaxID=2593676 RepID=UPI003696FEE7
MVGRSEDWVKNVERGERTVRSLAMIVQLARVLGCQDVNELPQADVSVPVYDGGKVTHPGVGALRRRSTRRCSPRPARRKTSGIWPGGSGRRGTSGIAPATSARRSPRCCPA